MLVNILGTEYTIEYKSIKDDDKLDEMEGYIDLYKKNIVIANIEEREYYKNEQKAKIEKVKRKVLRHEILHGFLFESGLDCNSNKTYSWADNEEMIDWFAIQSPKIFKVYRELGCYDENDFNVDNDELRDVIVKVLLQIRDMNCERLADYKLVIEKNILYLSNLLNLGIKVEN